VTEGGREAMWTIVSATWVTSIMGSLRVCPSAWIVPSEWPKASSVAAFPISIWVQAMLYGRPSREVDFVKPVIACLETVYAAKWSRGTWADNDPLLMILPPVPCFWNILNACCEHRNEPTTLMSKTDRKVSGEISPSSVLLAPIPALLNKRSSRPNVSMVVVKRRSTSSSLDTSPGTTSVSHRQLLAVVCSSDSRRANRTTLHPALDRAIAVFLPMPDEAPVTTATFSVLLSISWTIFYLLIILSWFELFVIVT